MITTSLEIALLILTVEFGLLAIAISLFSCRGARTAEAEMTADATELVSKVSNTEDSRRIALETVFRDKYQYEGDELDATVDKFMAREKAFYNVVVGTFLGHGKNKISNLNDELTKVVAPWISIMPKKMLDAEAAGSLVAEKSQMEAELGETKQVLEKMISEYNRAFRIEATEKATVDASPRDPKDDEMAEIEDIGDPLPSVDLTTDASTRSNDESSVSTQPDEDAMARVVDIDINVEEADDPGLVSAMIDEFDEELEAVAQTPVDRADKPMTADDLDDLMESLESEPFDDVQPA